MFDFDVITGPSISTGSVLPPTSPVLVAANVMGKEPQSASRLPRDKALTRKPLERTSVP
jgi:hypothetical protein